MILIAGTAKSRAYEAMRETVIETYSKTEDGRAMCAMRMT